MPQFLTKLLQAVDTRDVLGIIGVGLLTYGSSLVWPPAAFLVPGIVLTYIAIFGTR